MTASCPIVLVGPDEQENLALQYLTAAAEAAGHRVARVGFSGSEDRDEACRRTLAARPQLVGVAIPFQYAVDDAQDLIAGLRAAGYYGHITCGGHVPTFCYRELLRDCPGLDSAVRHEGEETLVQLAAALVVGRPPRDIDGLVWRDDDGEVVVGPPRPLLEDLDVIPWPVRPRQPRLVGGVPTSFVVSSRGCVGECAYCCIRAFGRDAGGPSFRLRRPEAVADEIAALYHMRQVRHFFVQDDVFLLPSPRQARQRLEVLTGLLGERGVDRASYWIKGRPESLTVEVARAARALGAIHVFLGVESDVPERLSYLGRSHTPGQNRAAIDACLEVGLRPSFNMMLFDPETTLEDVGSGLALATEHVDLQWNLCRTEVYSGTALEQRLRDEGRLTGDYRGYGYRMRDERSELLFRVLRVSFKERCFAPDSLLDRLVALSLARQLHQTHFPGPSTRHLSEQVDELVVEVHMDTLAELRSALDFARRADPRDAEPARHFAVEQALSMNGRALEWHERYERLWAQVNVRGYNLFTTNRAS